MNLRALTTIAGLVGLAAHCLIERPTGGLESVQTKAEATSTVVARQPASVPRPLRILKTEEKNLFAALERGDWSGLYAYLKNGDPNMVDAQGRTLLHWAAMYGNVEVLRALLKAGARIDMQDEDGRTPLMASAAENRADSVRLLVENYAALELKNEIGQTALLVAVENSHADIVDLLAAGGARLDPRFGEHDFNAYLVATVNGDYQMMDRLVKLDPRLALTEDREGRTAAHWGCADGNIDVVASVIRHGGRLIARDRYRETAFEYAARSGSDACVAFAEEGGLRDHM